MQSFLATVLALLTLLAAGPGLVLAAPNSEAPPMLPPSLVALPGQTVIIINVPEFRLRYYKNGNLAFDAPVAVGGIVTQTRLGDYNVANKAKYPTWHPPDGRPPVPPGPRNPLGPRWMGLDRNGYGIHGTIKPSSIGHAVSLGCIRMHNADVERLYEMVAVGTPVRLVYERIITSIPASPAEAWLKLYRDVYGKDREASYQVPKDDIIEHLKTMGLTSVVASVEMDILMDLLKRSSGEKVYLPFKLPLVLNDVHSKSTGVTIHGEHLIPLEPVVKMMGRTLGFDAAVGKPMLDGKPVATAKLLAGRSYLTPKDMQNLLGVECTYSSSDNTMKVAGKAPKAPVQQAPVVQASYSLSVNGTVLADKAFSIDGIVMVPLRPVCDALGLTPVWDKASASIWRSDDKGSATTSFKTMLGKSYMTPEVMAQFLDASVKVDETSKAIDVIPFVLPDSVTLDDGDLN